MGWNNMHSFLDAAFRRVGGDRNAYERNRRNSRREDQARNQILTNQAYRRHNGGRSPPPPTNRGPVGAAMPSSGRHPRHRHPSADPQVYNQGVPAGGMRGAREVTNLNEPNVFGMRSWDTILGRNNAARYPPAAPVPFGFQQQQQQQQQQPRPRPQRGANGYVDYLHDYWGPSPAQHSQMRRHGTPQARQRWQQLYGPAAGNAGMSGALYGDPRSGGMHGDPRSGGMYGNPRSGGIYGNPRSGGRRAR